MDSAPGRDGTEKEAKRSTRLAIEVFAVLETFGDQYRMHEGDERSHYMLCRHRRIDGLELTRRDAFAQHALSDRMHHLLMSADHVPAVLDRHEDHVMDAPFRQ